MSEVPKVFIDTKVTSNSDTGEVWEIAAIHRPAGGTREDDDECRWLLPVTGIHADPHTLDAARFDDRHPQGCRYEGDARLVFEWSAMPIAALMQARARVVTEVVGVAAEGAVLVGRVVWIHQVRLERMCRQHAVAWSWSSNPSCVEARTAALLGVDEEIGTAALAEAVGLRPAGDDESVTALGGARYARDWHDHLRSLGPLTLG